MGKCGACGSWNSFQEEVIQASTSAVVGKQVLSSSKPMILSEIKTDKIARIKTGIHELDQVVGGGIVPGSVILLVRIWRRKSAANIFARTTFECSNKKLLYIQRD